MVVDDNIDSADSLALLLKNMGHDVRTANEGQSAIEVAKGFFPEIVLLDIGLPGIDGYEVARRLRKEAYGREALLVALTGYGQEGDRRLTEEAGFDHHLTKPADPARLYHIIGQELVAPDGTA